MLADAIIGFSSIILASAISYVYHFASVRLLSPEIYGSLSVIIGAFIIASIPTQSIQRIVARDIANLSHKKMERESMYVLRKMLKNVTLLGVFIGLLFFISAYAISALYKEKEMLRPIQVLGILLPLWYVTSVLKGYIQGREKIFVLGVVLVLEQVSKLILGVALILLGYGLFGAAAPVGSGAVFVIPLLIFVSVKGLWGKTRKLETYFGASLVKFFLTDMFLTAFVFLDLFYVKYFLGSTQAAFYNVASLTSRVLSYAMGGVMYAFLPRASKLSLRDEWGEIRIMMLKCVLILLPLFTVLLLFPEQIVKISYTETYLSAVPALKVLLVGMFVYAVFNIPLTLMWSQHEEDFPMILSFAVLVLDGVLLYCLVPKYGLLGASFSTTISAFTLLFLSYAKVKKMRNFNARSNSL